MPITLNSFIDLDSVTRSYDGLNNPRLMTTALDLTDIMTFDGLKFEMTYDEVYTNGETKYVKFQMPPLASGRVVGFVSRTWKSLNGEASLEILWDSTGGTLGAAIPAFNSNRNSTKTSEMDLNVITGLTTEGTVRESDFLTGSGPGSNSSGSVDPQLGLRIYSPDSDAVIKITNDHNTNNRIILAYTWVELRTSELIL